MILSDRNMARASGRATVAKPDDGTGDSGVPGMTCTDGYDVRADADLDGAVTNSDKSALSGSKFALGRGFMSRDTTFNRRGYAGYENDGVLGDGAVAKSNTRFWHVRHRVPDSTLGRWTRRDPLSHADMSSLYLYVGGFLIAQVEPIGLCPDFNVCNSSEAKLQLRWLCHMLATVYCNAVRNVGGHFYCDAHHEACVCYDGPAR